MAKMDRMMGRFGNTLGEMTEGLFSGDMRKQFKAIGYDFDVKSIRKEFSDNGEIVAEADCWLENGDYVMAVEVKTDLRDRDVDQHLKRIERIRQNMDKKGDKRIIVGALAVGIAKNDAIKYAHNKGLYVIVQSGENITIAETPKGFKAREW